MQNLGRFYTTSDFDRKYLRNETRYPKSERYLIENDSSRVQRNKSSELWSTIHKVVLCVCTHSNRHFWDTIFRLLGVLAPEIFYTP